MGLFNIKQKSKPVKQENSFEQKTQKPKEPEQQDAFVEEGDQKKEKGEF